MPNNNFQLEVNKMVDEAKVDQPQKEVLGADSRFVKKVNEDYEQVKPFLKESGYELENIDSDKVEEYMHNLFDKMEKDEELQGLYKKGKHQEGNDLYNQRYGRLYNALDKLWDKLSTDEYVRKAPYGYIEPKEKKL